MQTIIRPVSDLSKRISDIETLCIAEKSAVHLTKNGTNHLVIMSSQHYDNLLSKIDMLEHLLLSESQIRKGQSVESDVAVAALHNFLEDRLNDKREQLQG